jgi:hypothetical protein
MNLAPGRLSWRDSHRQIFLRFVKSFIHTRHELIMPLRRNRPVKDATVISSLPFSFAGFAVKRETEKFPMKTEPRIMRDDRQPLGRAASV